MKPLNLSVAALAATMLVPVLTTSASAYQCQAGFTEAKVHKPTRFQARSQARKSWSYKVKTNDGIAWSVWNIASVRSMSCNKAGQRWVCNARAKPCLYAVH